MSRSEHNLPIPGSLALRPDAEVPFQMERANPHSLVVSFPAGSAPPPGSRFQSATLASPHGHISLGAGRIEPDRVAEHRRLVFTEQLYDFRKLSKGGTLLRLADRFRQLPLLLGYKESVSPAFAAWVSELSYDLRVYKMLFDEVDAGLAGESPETQAAARAHVRETQGRGFLLYMDEQIEALARQVAIFTKMEHERHGFYLRRQLWDLLLTSPFLARTNLRPRGYAGDSVMMQQIYRNAYEGATLFGQMLHKHPIESKAAEAVRNRRRMVPDTIRATRDALALPAERPLRFLSVACGPAWELRDLYRSPDDVTRFQGTLLDQDAEALSEARHGVAALEQSLGRPIPVRVVRESVRTMLRASDLTHALGTFHVVYSMGLFDYLNARVARAVLTRLYELLEPGGRLLVGNFHPQNHTRHYMAYFMDWMLIYRTEDELLALTELCPGAACALRFEETRSQMFLTVEKPA